LPSGLQSKLAARLVTTHCKSPMMAREWQSKGSGVQQFAGAAARHG
jgi:hypothetical protein